MPSGVEARVRPGIVVVRDDGESGYTGRQGGDFHYGASSATVGSTGLCMHVINIPPGSRGVPHKHVGHESAVYVVKGRHEIWHGEGFDQRLTVEPGDVVYIPADYPHVPVTYHEPVTVVVARTDPAEQESVHVLPLAGAHPLREKRASMA
ncbi:cupin domain-containing protein [Catellatospora vulcania]|uniref:cupin domain-containing protein n=1 Tax=Catellatospora vulcania TaxID=1460450 RepID=UPI0012D4B133|nr:cupin domain-containing protein [Catellatospora vulcania]